MTKPLISIVVPTFNEEANVESAYRAICDVFSRVADKYDFEIVFTDNHSTDSTFKKIGALVEQDSRVRAVRFARNFGFNRSVMTGYRLARGDAAIQIDCDLQDPPEMFLQFLDRWEKGHDVVVGLRRNREEFRILLWARRLFYTLLERFSDDNIMVDAGDFRLIDRSILNQLRTIDDVAPFTRGLTSQLAANQAGIPYDRHARKAGRSKFPLRRLFGLAIEGFLAHSIAPLRLASFVGMTVAVVLAITSVVYIVLRLFGHFDWPSGFTMTAVLIMFGIALNAIFLGIIGEYVGRIYNQVRWRPTTIIESALNVTEDTTQGASVTSIPIQTWPQRATGAASKSIRT